MICVPLFLIITGYLMKNKTLCKSYYFGLLRTLAIYILASLLCLLWRVVYFKEPMNLIRGILMIADYSACSYSWYIEMYIGLFLLIPFLNIVYRSLETRKKRLVLIGTLLILVAVPLQFNFAKQFFPQWWSSALFPIMYYYIGSYMRDYPTHLKAVQLFLLALAWIGLWSLFNYYLCIITKENLYGWHDYTDWGSLQNVGSSVLVFSLCQLVRFARPNGLMPKLLTHIATYSLGAYLLSWIFDKTLYPILLEAAGGFSALFPYCPIIVLCTFVGATLLSAVTTKVVETIIAPLLAKRS